MAQDGGNTARVAATARERKAQLEANGTFPAPYPSYVVTVKGFGAADIEMTGPHTGTMVTSNPNFTLGVRLSHEPTEPGVPNLTITLTKQP
jgi:hypothetical protein